MSAATTAVRVLRGTDLAGRGLAVEVDGDRIAAVRADSPGGDGVIVAGFVDLQVNGVGDVDCSAAGGADWERAGQLLSATGTTAWLPTLVSQPLGSVDAHLEGVRGAMDRQDGDRAPTGALVLGVHLEGPFLGGRPGAHRRNHVIDLDHAWLDGLGPEVRIVTLGPERVGALAAVASLAARGVVVSLGHSDADLSTARGGFDAGARMVTHLFNAMSPLHHREPGLVGAALADARVTVGLIADGVHVHASLLPVVIAAKGAARVAVVTDAVATATDAFGAVRARVIDGAPRLADGTIAGSILTMDQALRNLLDAGVAPDAAVTTLTATPATVLGDTTRGLLAPGRRADIVVLDPSSLQVTATVVGGRTVFEA